MRPTSRLANRRWKQSRFDRSKIDLGGLAGEPGGKGWCCRRGGSVRLASIKGGMIYTSSSTQTRPILRDTRALGLGIGDPLALHRRENAKLGRLQEPCRESWGPLKSSSASTGGNFDEGRKNTTVSSACRLQGILVGRCKRHRLGIQEMKSSKEHVQSKRDRRENPSYLRRTLLPSIVRIKCWYP
jgi:hypothetical protein